MDKKSFSLGLLIGICSGTITALLLAPKSGEETRHDICKKTEPLREKGYQLAHKATEKTIDLKNKIVDSSKKIKTYLKESEASDSSNIEAFSLKNETIESTDN